MTSQLTICLPSNICHERDIKVLISVWSSTFNPNNKVQIFALSPLSLELDQLGQANA